MNEAALKRAALMFEGILSWPMDGEASPEIRRFHELSEWLRDRGVTETTAPCTAAPHDPNA